MEYHNEKLLVKSTKHLQVFAMVNGICSNFIIDTGATHSCIDTKHIELFDLVPEKTKTKAIGAGQSEIEIQTAMVEIMHIGTWVSNNIQVLILDLSHINQVLRQQNDVSIHGIIGADLLMAGKCVIDYEKLELRVEK